MKDADGCDSVECVAITVHEFSLLNRGSVLGAGDLHIGPIIIRDVRLLLRWDGSYGVGWPSRLDRGTGAWRDVIAVSEKKVHDAILARLVDVYRMARKVDEVVNKRASSQKAGDG